jgi:hypothetical protein
VSRGFFENFALRRALPGAEVQAANGLIATIDFICAVSEEAPMKSCLLAVLLVFSAAALRAQQSVPEIPFDSVPNLLKLPPLPLSLRANIMALGEVFHSRARLYLEPA